jgi:CTP synthase
LGRKGIYDFVITEVGGTVGDIESLPYVEAIRQLKWQKGKDCLTIHLTLLPFLGTTGELKTKPTQHSVKELLSLGVQPDVLVCRTEHPMQKGMKEKIALFCNVDANAVIESRDADTIYDVPMMMQAEGLDQVVLQKLGITGYPEADLSAVEGFPASLQGTEERGPHRPGGQVRGIEGCLQEHQGSAGACGRRERDQGPHQVGAQREVDAEERGASTWVDLSGILVAPGFGHRGIEGKIEAIKYARENKIPFLGHLPWACSAR